MILKICLTYVSTHQMTYSTNSSPSIPFHHLFKYWRNGGAIEPDVAQKCDLPWKKKMQCKADDVGKKRSLKCKITIRDASWQLIPIYHSVSQRFLNFITLPWF